VLRTSGGSGGAGVINRGSAVVGGDGVVMERMNSWLGGDVSGALFQRRITYNLLSLSSPLGNCILCSFTQLEHIIKFEIHKSSLDQICYFDTAPAEGESNRND
jgi:hypothetical protein